MFPYRITTMTYSEHLHRPILSLHSLFPTHQVESDEGTDRIARESKHQQRRCLQYAGALHVCYQAGKERTEQSRTGQNRAEQSRAEQSRAVQDRTEREGTVRDRAAQTLSLTSIVANVSGFPGFMSTC
eukprot:765609-Hanusia_phi.AAC.1